MTCLSQGEEWKVFLGEKKYIRTCKITRILYMEKITFSIGGLEAWRKHMGRVEKSFLMLFH